MNIRNKIKDLMDELNDANYRYYVLERPIITDQEFDFKLKELIKLEKEFPEYKDENSPTVKVGGYVVDKFEKNTHKTPMLSLDNIFSYEELYEFDEKIKKEIGNDFTYVCEVKIDGLAMSLLYNNKLSIASTRGDGFIGENVTHNIRVIKSLPKKINYNDFEVRGEVYISKKNFEYLNKSVDTPYANTRNLASGSVRQLDSSIAKQRRLDMFCYGLVNPEKYNLNTYYESMLFLQKNHFKINTEIKLCNNIEDVQKYIVDITSKREKLPYDIDGIVIKINEYKYQNIIGSTSKYPKWAIAYKFPSVEMSSRIKDIFLTVGRTGKITPNVKIVPIRLMGSTIEYATLHNYDYILEKDIRVNDTAIIIKAGDVIPKVQSVVNNKNHFENKKYVMPTECPICFNKLVKKNNEYYCVNNECPAIIKGKLSYFVSKKCMNIDGISEKLIEKFYNHKLIYNYIDIYKLTYDNLLNIDGLQEKSINNILLSIKNSLTININKFITALGIKGLGYENTKILVKNINNINDLFYIKSEYLVKLDGFGEIIAYNIEEYFNNQKNIDDINEMLSLGLNLIIEKRETFINDNISNKNIVITGTFENYTRDQLKDLLEKYNAKIKTSISKNTDILIVGKNAGSKLKKAKLLNIVIIEENEFGDII